MDTLLAALAHALVKTAVEMATEGAAREAPPPRRPAPPEPILLGPFLLGLHVFVLAIGLSLAWLILLAIVDSTTAEGALARTSSGGAGLLFLALGPLTAVWGLARRLARAGSTLAPTVAQIMALGVLTFFVVGLSEPVEYVTRREVVSSTFRGAFETRRSLAEVTDFRLGRQPATADEPSRLAAELTFRDGSTWSTADVGLVETLCKLPVVARKASQVGSTRPKSASGSSGDGREDLVKSLPRSF